MPKIYITVNTEKIFEHMKTKLQAYIFIKACHWGNRQKRHFIFNIIHINSTHIMLQRSENTHTYTSAYPLLFVPNFPGKICTDLLNLLQIL